MHAWNRTRGAKRCKTGKGFGEARNIEKWKVHSKSNSTNVVSIRLFSPYSTISKIQKFKFYFKKIHSPHFRLGKKPVMSSNNFTKKPKKKSGLVLSRKRKGWTEFNPHHLSISTRIYYIWSKYIRKRVLSFIQPSRFILVIWTSNRRRRCFMAATSTS